MLVGADEQPLPVVTYVNANRLFAVTAVVLICRVVAEAATCTSPAGALAQTAGDAVELQLKIVPIELPWRAPYTPVGVNSCKLVVFVFGWLPAVKAYWSVIVVLLTGTNELIPFVPGPAKT